MNVLANQYYLTNIARKNCYFCANRKNRIYEMCTYEVTSEVNDT
jgi:hypothetical protein